MRRIRQLGFSDMVYPGATHSRFAHSIGVYHTARHLIEIIRRRQGSLDEQRARIVLLAALLHDIGHGPFSHVFEHVINDLAPAQEGQTTEHEDWSAKIVTADTQVRCVLNDEGVPAEEISRLLKKSDQPEDIYATVIASQFDADRLDYVQRDRLMTGVESAHLDIDWLFDCLEVGEITISQTVKPSCLYLNPKGKRVAEEYLMARFALYTMVYMHKTTRAAEVMLSSLLTTVANSQGLTDDERLRSDPVLHYFASRALDAYLDIDDAAVWATLGTLASSSHPEVSELARRLRDRRLFKCLDVGIRDVPKGNLFIRFKAELRESPDVAQHVLFDEDMVQLYKEPLAKLPR